MTVAGLGEPARDLRPDPSRVRPEHEDPIGQDDGLLDVVGHDQHRLGREVLFPPQPQQLGTQVAGGEDVEGREGLVHQQCIGLDHQGAGEAHPLAHPTGQLLGVGRLEAVETDGVDRSLGAGPPLPGRHPERLQAQLDVLAHGEPGQQGEALEHHGHARVCAVERLAPVADLPLRRGDQAGDATEQRALSRARSTEQRDDLALSQIEGDVLEYGQRAAIGRRERLAQVAHLDDRPRSRPGLGPRPFGVHRHARLPSGSVGGPGGGR